MHLKGGQPFNDCENGTAGFVFALFCFSFRPIISVFLRSSCNGDSTFNDSTKYSGDTFYFNLFFFSKGEKTERFEISFTVFLEIDLI